MPGPLLHVGATVLCSHGGQATPTVPNLRVLLSGQPATALGAPCVIAGCAMPPPPAGNGPCVTGQWLMGATRVFLSGQPALLQVSPSVCVPTGTPMVAAVVQTRVVGT